MSKDWTKQLIDDVSEIDNKCFNEMPLSIVIRTGQTDDGDRYFDAAIYDGEQYNPTLGNCLAEYLGAESLNELFQELNKVWS